MPESNPEIVLLKLSDVCRRVAVGRVTVYERMKHGDFPRPCYPAPRAPRWRSDEIAEYIERLSAKRAA